MRVNIEDSLTDDGHHGYLARVMGWTEHHAIGALYWVYRETQRAGFVSGSLDRAVTICVLRFDSDDECRKFLNAMVPARLAERDESIFRVLGNEKHVSRMATYRTSASKGGKATQSKRPIVSEATAQAIALPIAQAEAKPSLDTPFSLLPSPSSDTGNQIRDRDPVVPQAEPTKPPKRGRTPAEQARAKQVRDAFFDGHHERYGKPPDEWGQPENAHVYHLLKSSSPELLAEKARAYHRWNHAEVIRAGHPFMNHRWSFSSTRSELGADLSNPERRQVAAIAADTQRLADTNAANDGKKARVVAEFLEKQNATHAAADDRPDEQNRITRGDVQPTLVRGRTLALAEHPESVIRDAAISGARRGDERTQLPISGLGARGGERGPCELDADAFDAEAADGE